MLDPQFFTWCDSASPTSPLPWWELQPRLPLPWWEGLGEGETWNLINVHRLFHPHPYPPPSKGEGFIELSDRL